jgi:hypothetical protein
MKTVIAKAAVLLLVSLVVLPAAFAAQAGTPMRVEIPFAFLAGDHMYPAGAYEVRANSDFAYVEIREVKSAIAERVALLRTAVERKSVDPALGFLRFEQVGTTYTLKAVAAPNQAEGLAVRPSKAEKEMAKGGGAAGNVVTITQ